MGFNFFDWMSANRTTGNRGVNSFTAEPTYFGIILPEPPFCLVPSFFKDLVFFFWPDDKLSFSKYIS